MFFYLPCLAALITYYIFNSKGIDYRAVGIGALVPTAIDVFLGHGSLGHSFLFPIVCLVVVMVVTIKSTRMLRRRMLCFVIGVFLSLILEGTFFHESMWWWPLSVDGANDSIDFFPSLPWWIIRDVIGVVAGYVLFAIGDLHIKEKRDVFFSTGRITS